MSIYKSITDYIEGVKSEMLKVSFPHLDEVKSSTMIIILLVVIVSIFLGAVDWIFAFILTQVL